MERKKEQNQKVILDVTEKIIVEKGIRVITMKMWLKKLFLQQVPPIFTSTTRKVCLLQLMSGLIKR